MNAIYYGVTQPVMYSKKRNETVAVPIVNQKERQTYYEAVDYFTKEFFLKAYPQGNGFYTVSFLKELLKHKDETTKLMLIWDGASYHFGTEMQKYSTCAVRTLPKPSCLGYNDDRF